MLKKVSLLTRSTCYQNIVFTTQNKIICAAVIWTSIYYPYLILYHHDMEGNRLLKLSE